MRRSAITSFPLVCLLAGSALLGAPARADYWTGTLNLGATASGRTQDTLSEAGGAGTVARQADARSRPHLGIESMHLWRDLPFGLGATAEFAVFEEKGRHTRDTQAALFLLPRGDLRVGELTIWGSPAVGVLFTSAEEWAEQTGGLNTAYPAQSTAGLAISPRVGFDYRVNKEFTTGLLASLTRFKSTADGTRRLPATAVEPERDVAVRRSYTRTIFAIGWRFGFYF